MMESGHGDEPLDEDEDVAEIVDYTLSSDWERFVAAVEECLRQWELENSEGVQAPAEDKTYVSEEFTYNKEIYRLTYFYCTTEKMAVTSGREHFSQGMLALLSQVNQFPSRARRNQRWFGVRDFLLFVPAKDKYTNANESMLLQSTISISLLNTKCMVPAFIPQYSIERGCYHGYMISDGISTRFETDCMSETPRHFAHLSGMLDLFKSKLKLPASVAKEAQISISALYTFVQEYGYTTEMDGVDDSVVLWRGQEGGNGSGKDTPQPNDMGIYSLWGPTEDPCQALHLTATWPQFMEGAVVDNIVYSALDAMTAPSWSVRYLCAERPACILSESINALIDVLVDTRGSPSMSTHIAPLAAGGLQMNGPKLYTLKRFAKTLATTLKTAPSAQEVDQALCHLFEPVDDFTVSEDANSITKMFANTAPPESLLSMLSMYLALQGELRGMALLWTEFVRELRWHWEHRVPLPRVPAIPTYIDYNYGIMHQKLLMLNYCINRQILLKGAATMDEFVEPEKQNVPPHSFEPVRNDVQEGVGGAVSPVWSNGKASSVGSEDMEFFDSVEHHPNDVQAEEEDKEDKGGDNETEENKDETREGAECIIPDVILLVTGEPMYTPFTQDPGLMTADMADEQQEMLSRLGTSEEGAFLRAKLQSAQLLSDMQAFKAANPGCIMEDFVRWHSPKDWSREDEGTDHKLGDRGILSTRMREPGNLWEETWKKAGPIPASKQPPLFNHEKEAESVIDYFENITPSELFDQVVVVAFTTAFYTLSRTHVASLSICQEGLKELRGAIVERCRSGMDVAEMGVLCDMFEEVETLCAEALSLLTKLPQQDRMVVELLQNAEATVEKSSERKAVLALFARKEENMDSEEDPASIYPTSRLTSPTTREFILRCVAPRPHALCFPVPNRMYIMASETEFRIATALSSDE